ncbi:tetratricopeptide repeat protein 1 isoform X2 [Centroberyx gerrardi]
MEESEVLRQTEPRETEEEEDGGDEGGENISLDMNVQRDDQRSSSAAATPSGQEEQEEEQKEEEEQEQKEEEQDNFYDCQETLEAPDHQREERRKGAEEEKEEETQQEVGVSKDNNLHIKTDRRTDRGRGEENTEMGGGGGEGGGGGQEEAQWDRLEDGGMDSDAEMKEEENRAPEFDDDYLREVEKELTEEEKESRRQESLALKEEGNSQFKAGEWLEAERSYTEALVSCPVCYSRERAVLFSNRAAARLHLDLKDQAIADCSRAIELNPDYVRAILRRAELYEKTEKLDEALEDFQKVLEKDPGQQTARLACMRLPQQIHERNEKLKEEMMSKLKDLGNMFLRPFGLSTNNFQVNQDSDTGSYSVNFVQNPNNNNR